MAKIKLKSLFSVLVPLVLLVVFIFFIVFPEFLISITIKPRSHKGIGTETYTLATTDQSGKEQSVTFAMKRVPSGVAPGLCTDEPGLTVVNEPFLLAETEVTGALWDAVASSPASSFFTLSTVPQATGPEHPVEYVSWREAVVFCNALSVSLGFQPVYYRDPAFTQPIRSAAELAALDDQMHVDASSKGFRLPRSAEWEFAARYIDGTTWTPGGHPSGSSKPYYFDADSSFFAVYFSDSSRPVKSAVSNQLGIYDMSGNVWEWCVERFNWRDQNSLAERDTHKRVVRGGSWMGNFYRIQIGGEFGSPPELEALGQGFRLARSGW